MSLFGSGRREACLAVTLLVVAACAAQTLLLFGVDPAPPPAGESAVNAQIVMPALADAAAVLAGDEWPWWNPFARFGEPFHATGVQPLYPGYWPILFGGAGALPWTLALHSALACVFMFRWLRSLPASRFAAFVGAATYGIGVFFQLQLQRLPEAAALAWLPLALEGVWRLTRPGHQPALAVVVALGAAAMFITGAHAVPWLGVIACAFCAVLNLMRLPRGDRVPVCGQLGIAAAGTCLLAAPIWLQALQHAGTLVRGDAPPGADLGTRGTILSTLSPLPATHLAGGAASGDLLEWALYPGTIVLVMVALSILRPSPAQPRWPWLLLATLGLLGAISGPWTAITHDQLGLDADRPGASLVLLQLGLLVLACLGLDEFLESPFRRRGAVLALGGVALVIGLAGLGLAILRPSACSNWVAGVLPADNHALAAAGQALALAVAPTALCLTLLGGSMLVWRRLGVLRFKIAIGLVAFFDILYFAWATAPSRAVPSAIEIVGVDSGRVLATDGPSVARLHRSGAPARRVNRSGDAVLARTATFLEEAVPGALAARARVDGQAPQAHAFSPSVAALGQIDVLLGETPLLAAAPAGPDVKVPASSPWARLLFAARYFSDKDSARRALHERALADNVLLETSASEFIPRAPLKPATLRVLEHKSQRARVQVDVGQGRGYLVIADAHAPGWIATLDGEPVPLLAADVAFRAIAIPEGEHEVQLRYAPWSQRIGLPLCGLGLLLCGAWVIAHRRK